MCRFWLLFANNAYEWQTKLRRRADDISQLWGHLIFVLVFLEGDRKWKFLFVARMFFVCLMKAE